MIRKVPVYLKTDLRYRLVTYNLSTMESVEHAREKSAKGRFAFTVENDLVFVGTLIQVTSSGCVNIYMPEDAPKEEIVEKTLKLLSKANEGPVKVIRSEEASPEQLHETRKKPQAALHHSKMLIWGFESLLLEDKPMWLAERHSSAWTSKVETKGARTKQFAEQHLKDRKYLVVREKLAAHRRLNAKIRREYELGEISKPFFDSVVNAVENAGESLSEKQEKHAKEIMKKKWASYQKLASHIRLLEAKVRHGTPLDGKCQLCRD